MLSFIPYLQQPPTQTKTATVPVTPTNTDTHKDDDVSRSASATQETSRNDDPYGPRRWHSSLVKLAGKSRAINEFSVERVGEPVDNDLVLLHGYGAGLGFYYRNFEPLSRAPGWRLHALDMLGMGRSSRPAFRIHAKDRAGRIAEAEGWFVDALEEWRVERKLDRFTLVGHSLGGYMAVAYALKYPGRLKKLILASPVGIPEDPYAVSADMPESADAAAADAAPLVASEFADDQAVSQGKASGGGADNNNFMNARSKHTSTSASASTPGSEQKKRPYPWWLTSLWDANISPFSLVRWAGPLGPRLVSGWTSRRFSQLPPAEAQALHDYAYALFRQRGSGEYALAYILAPGAFARDPLIRRIGQVGRRPLPNDLAAGAGAGAGVGAGGAAAAAAAATEPAAPQPRPRERGIPVVMLYGDHDWMDVQGGHAAKAALDSATADAVRGMSAADRARDMGAAKVLIVRNAGHHVYLDGADEFNDMMRAEMADVERRDAVLEGR